MIRNDVKCGIELEEDIERVRTLLWKNGLLETWNKTISDQLVQKSITVYRKFRSIEAEALVYVAIQADKLQKLQKLRNKENNQSRKIRFRRNHEKETDNKRFLEDINKHESNEFDLLNENQILELDVEEDDNSSSDKSFTVEVIFDVLQTKEEENNDNKVALIRSN